VVAHFSYHFIANFLLNVTVKIGQYVMMTVMNFRGLIFMDHYGVRYD